jgi:SPP1 gp7 family putative phage head morphogenesis protein
VKVSPPGKTLVKTMSNVCRCDAAPKRVSRSLIPIDVQFRYFRAIKAVLDQQHEEVLAESRSLVGTRTDAKRDPKVEAELERMARRILAGTEKPIKELPKQFAKATSKKQREDLNKKVRKALGVDLVGATSPRVEKQTKQFLKSNVRLIKSVQKRYLNEVQEKVLKTVESGTRWETLADDLHKTFEISKARARLIARDQVGKYYSALNQARQEDLGVEAYTWRTSEDNRVRLEHEARKGRVFRWDKPPADGHPGEPVLCRCFAEPRFGKAKKKLAKARK